MLFSRSQIIAKYLGVHFIGLGEINKIVYGEIKQLLLLHPMLLAALHNSLPPVNNCAKQ